MEERIKNLGWLCYREGCHEHCSGKSCILVDDLEHKYLTSKQTITEEKE